MPPLPPSPQPSLPPGDPALKAADYAAVRDWPGYYRKMLGKPARETLIKALSLFDADGVSGDGRLAIDLGCGEGRDTLELLRRGWSVLATDEHPEAFVHLLSRVDAQGRARLTTSQTGFHQTNFPAADLINASYALPFCEPRHFAGVWSAIRTSLKPGARFAGQLFGDRDTWAALPDRSHQTEPEARALLNGLVIEQFDVEEKDDADALGRPKHWHIFHVVARRL